MHYYREHQCVCMCVWVCTRTCTPACTHIERSKIWQVLKVGNRLLLIKHVASLGFWLRSNVYHVPLSFLVLLQGARQSHKDAGSPWLPKVITPSFDLPSSMKIRFLPLLGRAWVCTALFGRQPCEGKKAGTGICPVSPYKTQQGQGCGQALVGQEWPCLSLTSSLTY